MLEITSMGLQWGEGGERVGDNLDFSVWCVYVVCICGIGIMCVV